ncbi:MAG: SMC family ATPase [archaeon]
MILRWVKLENIRSYKHEIIKFPEGSLLLSGDIGSGKSTILLAIEFALFGIMRAELSGTALLRHGASKGFVELAFEIESKEYIIKRSLKKSKTSVGQENGYLIVDGKKIEGTPVELKAKVLQILGYPEELVTRSKSLVYRFTVYTAQEEMKQIIFEDKDLRLDTLRKVFGIDKYKTIRENSGALVRDIKKKKSENEARLEILSEYEKEKKDKSAEIIETMIKIENIKKEIAEISIKITERKNYLSVLEKEIRIHELAKNQSEFHEKNIKEKQARAQVFRKRINESAGKKNQLEKRIHEFSKITNVLSEKEIAEALQKLQDNLDATIKENSSLSEKISSWQSQIKLLDEEIKKMSHSSKEAILLKSALSEEKSKIDKKTDQETSLEKTLDSKRRIISKMEQLDMLIQKINETELMIKDESICPVCKQSVSATHKHEIIVNEKEKILNYTEEKNKLIKNIDQVDGNIKKIKKNLDIIAKFEKKYLAKSEQLVRLETESSNLVAKQKEISMLHSLLRESQDKLVTKLNESDLRREIAALTKELTSVRENNLSFREKMHIMEIINQENKNITSLSSDLTQIEEEIKKEELLHNETQKKLSSYNAISEDYSNTKKEIQTIEPELKSLDISLAALTQQVKSAKEDTEKIEVKIRELDRIRKEVDELAHFQLWLETFFVNLMVTMEKHIMVSIHKEFSSFLKEWFSVMIEDIDISLDDEFSVSIMQDGYENSVEYLSGGEKTSVALAYRLALNKVINDLIPSIKTRDLIILDEPTDGFSTEQLDKVRDILLELDMKQTIIVSHEAKMESYVDKVIKISKSDGVSKVTV